MPLTISNLSDLVRLNAGEEVLFDVTGDAQVTLGAANLSYMTIGLSGGAALQPWESLTIGGNVSFPDGFDFGDPVFVGNTAIGTVGFSGDARFRINFDASASAAAATEILRGLTYNNASTPADAVEYRRFVVDLFDMATGSAFGLIDIAVAPDDVVLVQSRTTVAGTTGDDIFLAVSPNGVNLAGGEGYDVLVLNNPSGSIELNTSRFPSFSGIDEVRGTSAQDTIRVDAALFSRITRFDAGPNGASVFERLELTDGTTFDFRGKTVANFDEITLNGKSVATFSDKTTALLANGRNSTGERLVLIGDTFLPDERTALLAAGVDTFSDESGTYGNLAPVVTGLDGEVIGIKAGETVSLDQGTPFDLADTGKLKSLTLDLEMRESTDRFGVRESSLVKLSGPYVGGVTVMVGGIDIGTLSIPNQWKLTLNLKADATVDQVEAVVHALTFVNTNEVTPGYRNVAVLTVEDEGGLKSVSRVQIKAANLAPTDVALNGASVAENTAAGTIIGTVTGVDPEGDALTFALLDDAIGRFELKGGQLVVRNGAMLDYESAKSHTIRLQAKDADGLTIEKAFTISVNDVAETPPIKPLVLTGTLGADILVGDGLNDILTGLAGNDRLSGLAGNDRLSGGVGKDVLEGGSGQDMFVFDARLKSTNAANKRFNLDQLTDFSVADDTVHLAKSVFKALPKKGVLARKAFYTGNAAHDADDRIVYNKKTGALSYDSDGNGGHAAVQFATLSKNLKLTYHDFLVI